MFRAIDPDGLVAMAGQLSQRAAQVRREMWSASMLLTRHARQDVATTLLATERWADATAGDLRWRAAMIRAGQRERFDLSALLGAEFAATGVFAPGTRTVGFATWLRKQECSRQRVADAVGRIGDWLGQGWLDWDVTNGDLHNITTKLESLSGSELDQVIAALSPRQLARWVTEMGHSLNGFSREEKQGVFELLAADASGVSLHRIHEALLSSSGQTELIDLGRAIRLHSPDATIVEFVTATVTQDLLDQRFSTLAPGLAVQGLEDPTQTTRAAGVILEHRQALPWFLGDAVVAGEKPGGLITALSRTAEGGHLAAGFVTALSLMVAPGGLGQMMTARHFAIHPAGEHTPHRLLDETEQQLLAAAAGLLAEDPETVVTHLATTADPDGDLTTAFWYRLVDSGDAESIAAILQRLRGGIEVDLARFSSRGTDSDYEYPHARNLAFAAATLNRGFVQSAEDAKGDIDAICRVAGVATTVAGLFAGGSAAVAESLIGTGSGWTVESHATTVETGIDGQLESLIDTATSRLRPPDGADLAPHSGAGNALLAWTSVYTRLVPRA